jgi:hypothetical protein
MIIDTMPTLVQVFLFGIVLGRILLGYEHQQFIAVEPLVHRLNRTGPPNKQRDDHVVEDNDVPDRHHWQRLRNLQILYALSEIPQAGGQRIIKFHSLSPLWMSGTPDGMHLAL